MNGGLYALTQDCGGGSDFIYSWDTVTSSWTQYAEASGHRSDGQRMAQANGMLFGLAEGLRNISVSRDISKTWETLPAVTPANGDTDHLPALDMAPAL